MRIRAVFLAATLARASVAWGDGLVWTPTGALEASSILALGADPHTPGTLYASVYQEGFFKSTDSGVTWSPADAGLPMSSEPVISIAFEAASPEAVWVVAGDRLHRSADGGATWTDVPLPTDYGEEYFYLHVVSVATDPNVPDLVYAGVWLSGVNSIWPEHAVRSTNGGADWSVLPVRTYYTACGGIRVDPFASAVHFANLFVSHDFGETWTADEDVSCGALVWDPSDRSILYRGRFEGVDRSLDGGATWIPVNEGLNGLGVHSLAVDPFDPTRVYAGSDSGIFTRIFPKRAEPTLAPRSRPHPRRALERP